METELEKIAKAKAGYKRWYSAIQLTAIAEKIFETKSAIVWFSRQDGWWLETDDRELFLGCDSKGAKRTLDALEISKMGTK